MEENPLAIPNENVLKSAPFKFLIGSSKTLFTIHTALVAHHSKALGVLVSGPMREAEERCAWLKEVDEHTFFRFGQYLYTGDYTAADPEILLDSSNVPAENSNSVDELTENVRFENDAPRTDEELDGAAAAGSIAEPAPEASEPPKNTGFEFDDWGFASGLSRKDKKKKAFPTVTDAAPAVVKSKKSLLWEDFKSLSYSHSGPAFKPRKNREACEVYIEVFLSHARLYVFADTYVVDSLRLLSLQKLQQTLVEFTLYEERLGDVVELLRYGYSNTADHTNSNDALRLLIIRYAACVVEKLSRNEAFRSLLEDPGLLAKDLVEEMLKRLD